MEAELLSSELKAIKRLGDFVTNLKLVGKGLGEYQFDKNLLTLTQSSQGRYIGVLTSSQGSQESYIGEVLTTSQDSQGGYIAIYGI